MGLGDEIMALGRAEEIFEKTGKPVSIVNEIGAARRHDAWVGNPAWDERSSQKLLDCASHRAYIKHWAGRKIVFNLDHRPRAGKIFLTDEEKSFNKEIGDYLVISPNLKKNASENKGWGFDRYQKIVLERLNMRVIQLISSDEDRVLNGVDVVKTKHFRQAASIISGAKMVLCNEGGAHHMAASMGVPAVVIFGAFVPPKVTGYDFHDNISVETDEGFCGNWDRCKHCSDAMKKITIDLVHERVEKMWGRV